jgi:hypothetical protein
LDAVSEAPIESELHRKNTSTGHESLPLTTPARRLQPSNPVPVKSWYVYVDDFIGMVQGIYRHHQYVKQILLTSLDKVLWRLDDQDNIHQQEQASIKKMLKLDATWATHRIVLGWLMETCAMTVQLPKYGGSSD